MRQLEKGLQGQEPLEDRDYTNWIVVRPIACSITFINIRYDANQ